MRHTADIDPKMNIKVKSVWKSKKMFFCSSLHENQHRFFSLLNLAVTTASMAISTGAAHLNPLPCSFPSSVAAYFFALDFMHRKFFPSLPTAIGNAYAVLSNPEKRRQYDQYGDQSASMNTPQQSTHSRHGHYRSFHRDFEADISPEELFNMFFGGRFPTGMTGGRLLKRSLFQVAFSG